ncbi:ankyrin repeat domain-containing protein [Acaryochloris marina]|uniref:Ankyrin repeat protein n=1 Tax=Acaryochloris marina (strain MBIC 11017) TaxID=329726 RepID=B0C5I4_ACAM1|nr:ankyrin repeat domain-containing protein [Acaryochloris marina]ABW27560.1 ankyrin repeat protein [Acaryochloris marina MBIC11017]BDM82296.1 hypothetical protein AM10699_51600 [Acaryochloris marina MBIC10699]
MPESINYEWLNLTDAINSNHLDQFKIILAENQWSDLELASAAQHASQAGSLEILKRLIKYGADINLTVGEETALTAAVYANHYEIVFTLLNAGANPSLPIHREVDPPLFIAADKGYLDLVQLLVSAGANANQTVLGEPPIIYAALSGHQDIYDFLLPMTQPELLGDAAHFLQKGIRQKYRDENINPVMETAYDVVFEGDVDGIKKLLMADIPLNDFCRSGSTLLNLAVIKRFEEFRLPVTLALLESGADPNLADDYDDMTPIMRTKQPEIVAMLISFGADVNAMTHNKTTALLEAAKSGSLSVVKLLLESGADPKHEDAEQKTAIDYALENQHLDVVHFLQHF